MQLYSNTLYTSVQPSVSHWFPETQVVPVLNILGWIILFNKLVQINYFKDYVTFRNAGSLIPGWASQHCCRYECYIILGFKYLKECETAQTAGILWFFLSFKCLNSLSLCYAKHLLGSIWCDYAVKDHICTTAGIEPFKGYIYLKNMWNTSQSIHLSS